MLSRKLAARPLLPDDIEASARLLSSKCQKFTLVYTDKEFALRHWGVCERVQIPPWGPCSWDDVGNCPAELALQRLHCHHHEPTVHSLRGQPSDVRFRCSHQISHLGKLLSCLLLLPEWLLQGPLFFALPACSSKHRWWVRPAKPGSRSCLVQRRQGSEYCIFSFYSGRIQGEDFRKKLKTDWAFLQVVINWHFLSLHLQI